MSIGVDQTQIRVNDDPEIGQLAEEYDPELGQSEFGQLAEEYDPELGQSEFVCQVCRKLNKF